MGAQMDWLTDKELFNAAYNLSGYHIWLKFNDFSYFLRKRFGRTDGRTNGRSMPYPIYFDINKPGWQPRISLRFFTPTNEERREMINQTCNAQNPVQIMIIYGCGRIVGQLALF